MKKMIFALCALVFAGFTACNDDEEVGQRDISVEFNTAAQGLDGETTDISLTLSRKSEVEITAEITLTPDGAVYGTDFTTLPTATDGKISVTIPANVTTQIFNVNIAEGVVLDGTKAVTFTLNSLSVTEGVKIGTKNECKLTFGGILSEGGKMTLEGRTGSEGAAIYANSVFVDFSENKQVGVDRTIWDLGFACGADFRVYLNGAAATVAVSSGKTDIAQVTLDDAQAMPANKNLSANPMMGTLDADIMDGSDGRSTVIADISADDAENMVYFVASESDKTSRDLWWKVKVTRRETGYSIQYARVGETTVKTQNIEKAEGYNMVFFSLHTDAVVSYEPEAAKWDIKWSYDTGMHTYQLYPFFMQDFVSVNSYAGVGASVAEIMTADIAYANYNASDINAEDFRSVRDGIGDKWRNTSVMGAMPEGSVVGVNADRFYVVKDREGNYYKLRFLKAGLNNDGGDRGRPQIEYELVD